MITFILPLAVVLLTAYAALTLFLYYFRFRPKLAQHKEFLENLSLTDIHGMWQAAGEKNAVEEPADQSTSREAALVSGPESTLHQRLDDWRLSFDAIMDPVLILDTDLRVINGNKAAQELLATDDRSIRGKKCHELYAGSDQTCSVCPIPTGAKEKKPYGQEITHRYLGRTFFSSCSPIMQNDEIVGYVQTVKDISHQRNLEKQLVQAHKMEAIATLAGGIAHDFNNILGAILGNADLLLYRLPTHDADEEEISSQPITFEEITEHVVAIKRAGGRAKELVSQILAFSRQSINKRSSIVITPIIKEACKLLRSLLPATIELKLSISRDVGYIYGDPTQIQQVVMNLGSNAAQAIDDQTGTIEISLREVEAGIAEQARYHELTPGKYVVLTVRDTGKGISGEVLERIFDPFFTTRDVGSGTGMGLAVLHGIILSHDGVIDVQSDLGKGSVFTIFFPRIKMEDREEQDVITAMPRGTETILFVDDEEDIVKMRTRMLEYLGYRVLQATKPEQALGYFKRGTEEIDLMITDHTMPRMTGLQLAAEAIKYNKNLPIILCSGYSEAVTQEEAEKAGIRRFLAKPMDTRLLAIAIRELLPNKDVE